MYLKNWLTSSLGQKFLMALTGVALMGFALAHLSGNLLIYLGPDALNEYAKGLHTQPMATVVWFMRFALLGFFGFHVFKGIRLSMFNRSVSPKYKNETVNRASLSSRTMIISGVWLLCFIAFHLAHYTFKVADPSLATLSVYEMVIVGFSKPLVSIFYILSMICLWLHLCHGGSSVFQSLGFNFPQYKWFFGKVGPLVATVLLVGNCSIPLAVMCGFIK